MATIKKNTKKEDITEDSKTEDGEEIESIADIKEKKKKTRKKYNMTEEEKKRRSDTFKNTALKQRTLKNDAKKQEKKYELIVELIVEKDDIKELENEEDFINNLYSEIHDKSNKKSELKIYDHILKRLEYIEGLYLKLFDKLGNSYDTLNNKMTKMYMRTKNKDKLKDAYEELENKIVKTFETKQKQQQSSVTDYENKLLDIYKLNLINKNF